MTLTRPDQISVEPGRLYAATRRKIATIQHLAREIALDWGDVQADAATHAAAISRNCGDLEIAVAEGVTKMREGRS